MRLIRFSQCLVVLTLLGVVSVIFLSSPQTALAEEPTAAAAPEETYLRQFNSFVQDILFFDISSGAFRIDEVDRNGEVIRDPRGFPKIKKVSVPFLVIFIAAGCLFFTLWFSWINVRALKHSLDVIRGKYDRPEDKGEISHFRALTSALSATVGLGNIAGVAIAIQTGGPGAVFWMFSLAVFSMSAKFSSCTLAQMYRQENADGSISGGPMYYLDIGLRQRGVVWGVIGKILAVMFAFMVMGGALGAGNMFQANQATAAIIDTFGLGDGAQLAVGLVLAVCVGIVILGGIKRIGLATSRIVPLMCGVYCLAALYVIFANISRVPEAIELIFTLAFSKNAFFGGMIGVMVTGLTRAAFSNEGGLGSASIAHAAAKTDEPAREGLVAMAGPVIDTMIVCTMTGLVVILTGAWNNPEILAESSGGSSTLTGVLLTSRAFESVIPWFPAVLTGCVVLFAYSTMVSWCYYGERGWIYLADQLGISGIKTVVIFRLIFVFFVVYGAVNQLGDVLDFSDMMILSMAFPNILGSIILAPKAKAKLQDYWSRYKSGAFSMVD